MGESSTSSVGSTQHNTHGPSALTTVNQSNGSAGGGNNTNAGFASAPRKVAVPVLVKDGKPLM